MKGFIFLTVIVMVFFITQPLAGEVSDTSKISEINLPIYNSDKQFIFKGNGKGKTLINFWASWCTSCIQELPILEKLKKDHPNVTFIAINAGESKGKIKKFLKKNTFTYKILMDKDKSFSKGLGVLSLPQTFVVDASGKVIYHGEVPPKDI